MIVTVQPTALLLLVHKYFIDISLYMWGIFSIMKKYIQIREEGGEGSCKEI